MIFKSAHCTPPVDLRTSRQNSDHMTGETGKNKKAKNFLETGVT